MIATRLLSVHMPSTVTSNPKAGYSTAITATAGLINSRSLTTTLTG